MPALHQLFTGVEVSAQSYQLPPIPELEAGLPFTVKGLGQVSDTL